MSSGWRIIHLRRSESSAHCLPSRFPLPAAQTSHTKSEHASPLLIPSTTSKTCNQRNCQLTDKASTSHLNRHTIHALVSSKQTTLNQYQPLFSHPTAVTKSEPHAPSPKKPWPLPVVSDIRTKESQSSLLSGTHEITPLFKPFPIKTK